jgi:hypothetical protein
METIAVVTALSFRLEHIAFRATLSANELVPRSSQGGRRSLVCYKVCQLFGRTCFLSLLDGRISVQLEKELKVTTNITVNGE